MSQTRKPNETGGEQVGEETKPVAPAADTSTGKTLQELERIQFDAIERLGR
ncbi:MAG TPA: hypothetical protein VK427_18665 [Kofleriaceae bacterium]|nr:hypothetical protein [Kofleriaceae bacterium]